MSTVPEPSLLTKIPRPLLALAFCTEMSTLPWDCCHTSIAWALSLPPSATRSFAAIVTFEFPTRLLRKIALSPPPLPVTLPVAAIETSPPPLWSILMPINAPVTLATLISSDTSRSDLSCLFLKKIPSPPPSAPADTSPDTVILVARAPST